MSAAHAPSAGQRAATPAPARTGALTVSIVTPEGLAFEGAARSVVVPGHDGEVAFFPLHAAYVGVLGFGELRIAATDGHVRRWFLEGGVAEVADDAVTVLAERVLAPEKIDAAKARADLAQALAEVATSDPDRKLRERALASARGRLRVAGGPTPPAHAH